MLTIQKIRQAFINTYLGGKDREDRRSQNAYLNEIIMQARSLLISEAKEFDTEWVQEIVLDMETVNEDTGIYHRSVTAIPTVIDRPDKRGIYMISSDQRNQYAQENFEVLPYDKFRMSVHDKYTRNKTKVSVLQGKMYIRTKSKLGKKIKCYCVFYDPFDVVGFKETDRFPFSPSMLVKLTEIMNNLYLNKLASAKENENNSAEENRPPAQQERQQ